MSRIGRKPIPIPSGVQVNVRDHTVAIKGSRGELSWSFDPSISVEQKGRELLVGRSDDEKQSRALHGLARSLINNMVIGVSQGFQKSLEIVGVGYRATQQGAAVAVQVGYSKPKVVEPLPGLQLEVEGQNRIHVRGARKDLVGQMAATIRELRPPDRYKGKGIRYVGEVVQLKAGKGGRKQA
ncbi:MAG: RplF [Dehalococcoidia bacterium]|nr:RplF [Dehalococcoidia bacterium]